MSAEFPKEALLAMRERTGVVPDRDTIDRALSAYKQLAHRCVMDNTKHSITIAALRERIAELEAEAAPYSDPLQLDIET